MFFQVISRSIPFFGEKCNGRMNVIQTEGLNSILETRNSFSQGLRLLLVFSPAWLIFTVNGNGQWWDKSWTCDGLVTVFRSRIVWFYVLNAFEVQKILISFKKLKYAKSNGCFQLVDGYIYFSRNKFLTKGIFDF